MRGAPVVALGAVNLTRNGLTLILVNGNLMELRHGLLSVAAMYLLLNLYPRLFLENTVSAPTFPSKSRSNMLNSL